MNEISADNLTIRDYFAANAIRCFSILGPADGMSITEWIEGGHPKHHLVAKFCYDLADAMLVEREKRIKEGGWFE